MRRERRGARIILLTPQARFLLFHFQYDAGPLAGTEYWGLPGGGVEDGETVHAAAVRELYEETGLRIDSVGPTVAEGRYDFRLSTGEEVIQHDWYFLHRIDSEIPLSREGFTPEERRNMAEAGWWKVDELAHFTAPVIPADMAQVIAKAGG